jgi:hypothetical protein
MGDTATIRVPIETRDRLATVAEERGISLARLLTEYATREHIHQIYADERKSWSEAIANPGFVAELQEWDALEPDEFD